MTRRTLTSDVGLTVTELLVVLVLIGIVMSTAYFILSAGYRMTDQIEARDVASTQARIAIERVTRELRQARELSEGAGVFADAQPRRCSFYVDLNHDQVPERITYYVQGKVLYRSQAVATGSIPPYAFGPESGASAVIESVKGGWNGNVFTYYDNADPADEVSSGHPEDISAVALKLVSEGSAGRQTVFVERSTWVRIRTVHNSIR